MIFEWDENKNAINIKKHGIDFNEAVMFDDPEHSEDEERFLLIGMSKALNILTVCHCYRADDEVIRLISARKATKTETEFYVQYGGKQ